MQEGEYMMKKAKKAPMARMMCKEESMPRNYAAKMAYNDCMNDMFGGGFGSAGKRAVTLQRKLNTHNNFLSNVGHVTSNLSDLK